MSASKRRYSQHAEPAVFAPTSSKQRRLSTISPQTSITAAGDSNIDYCLGAITYIKLTNFMSHHDFEWKPGPKVNLITGRNGAGKSSILQAIVIGLGENAKATRRSQNLSEFVNNDAVKAEIIIHLCNIPDEFSKGYRPDFYGNAVIFHRQIYKNGTSVYTIKGLHGERTGAAATEERAKIVSHFNLDIGNPTVVLQQEEAKSFFRNHDPKSMYQFFEKGSLLVDVRESMSENVAEIGNFKNTLQREEEDVKAREKEIHELETVQGLFQKNEKFQDKMTMKQKWAKVKNEFKPQADKSEKAYNDAVKSVKACEKNLEMEENALLKKSEERDKVKIDEATLGDQYQNVNNTYKEKKTVYDKDERDLKNMQEEVAQLERDIRVKNDQNQRERNEYRTQKSNNRVGEEGESVQQLEAELQNVEDQKSDLCTKIIQSGNERDKIRTEIEEWDKKGSALKDDVKRKQNEKRALSSEEKTLNQSKNELAKYGKQMENLCQDIERNSNQFSSRPIGPLGTKIKLSSKVGRDDNLANLIQNQVGIQLIKSFLVQNRHDRDILFSLMRKQNFHKQPPIYTKKSEGKRYDISRRRTPNTQGASIMLDYFEFKNDEVFNLVVDRISPENILITTEDRAQELFMYKQNVPKNATRAITDEWNSYSHTASYSSYYIRKPNYVTTFLIQEENLLQKQFLAKHQVIDKEIKALQDEQKKNSDKTRELQSKWQKFVDQNEKDKQKLAIYNQDINKFKGKIQKKNQNNRTAEEWKMTFELYDQDKTAKIAEKTTKIQEISARKAHQIQQRNELSEMVKTIDKYNANYNKVHDALTNLNKVLQMFENQKETAKKDLENAKRNIVVLETKFKDCKNKYETIRAEALELSNGIEMSDADIALDNKEYQALERERIRTETALKKKHGNNNKVVRELEEKIKDLAERKVNKEINKVIFKEMQHGISSRCTKINEVKNLTSREVRRVFNEQIRDCHMKGEIDINAKKNVLEIKIKPMSESPEPVPLSSLSGGEKSKTLACLIRSFWQFQCGPFKGLDEWDVFLDDKSRKDVETMLVEGAKKWTNQQFFFISPQNSAYNNPDMRKLNGDRVVIMDLEKSGDTVNNNR